MGIPSRASGIANAAFQATASGVELFTDIVKGVYDDEDEYDGVAGTIWGSWNDNVLGEGGVLQSLFGPEGVGGQIIGGLPEYDSETDPWWMAGPGALRTGGRPIFNAAFDAIDTVYEYGVDRPIAVAITLANAGLMDGFVLNYLDPRVWQQVNEILGVAQYGQILGDEFASWLPEGEGGGRSSGQALALMVNRTNILDPTEVERVEGTAQYKIMSGIADAAMQWYLDPSNIAGMAVRGAKASNIQKMKALVAEGNYQAVLDTTGYRNFKEAINDLSIQVDGLSEQFRKGQGFTKSDESLINKLSIQIWKAARKGNLGRGFKNFTIDQAKSYAVLSGGLDINKMDQAFDYLIRIQLGDVQALDDMRNIATDWVRSTLEGGLYAELLEVGDELKHLDQLEERIAFGLSDEAGDTAILFEEYPELMGERLDPASVMDTTKPTPLTADTTLTVDDIIENKNLIEQRLKQRQREIESELFINEYASMPFAAALIMKQERLRTMAQYVSNRGEHAGLNNFDEMTNADSDLVTAAANEILIENQINILDPLPQIGEMSKSGIAAKTFISQSKFGQSVGNNMIVRAIVEKIPHQLMNWDDPAQQVITFERMLRDAQNVVYDGVDLVTHTGRDIDAVLGRFTDLKTQREKREFFDSTVQGLNQGLVTLFHGKTAITDNMREMTSVLQRQWGRAQDTLREKARVDRRYSNSDYTIVDHASDGVIDRRYLPLTPAQLREASLVPRYDLYQQAFGDVPGTVPTTKFQKAMQDAAIAGKAGARATLGAAQKVSTAFTSVWSRSVLLRPAWPLRVIIDEAARSAATIGAQATIQGLASGMNDLRVAWFRKHGIDVGDPIMQEMLSELMAGQRADEVAALGPISATMQPAEFLPKRWKEWEDGPWELAPDDYNEILQSWNKAEAAGNTTRSTQELVEEVIAREYGAKRIFKRTALTTGLGLLLAGPVGAMSFAGLYYLQARNTLQRVARSEINANQMFALRQVAHGDLRAEIDNLRKQVSELDPDDVATARRLGQEAEELQTATRLLETQAENLTVHEQMLKDKLKASNRDLYDNFDKVGLLAAESGYNNFYVGGYSVENAFGNTPTDVSIYKNAISSDNSMRQIWDGTSVVQRRTNRQRSREQYDVMDTQQRPVFAKAYNDTVNRQWLPKGDANGPFQKFMRLFWEGKTDEEIFRFMQNEGRVVRDAFGDELANPESLRNHIEKIRIEANAYIPNLPEFAHLRKKAATGGQIDWVRDIVPVIEKRFNGNVEEVRQAANTNDFGKVVADASFQDIVDKKVLQVRVMGWLDNAFENIGTMPTDALTRSTVFNAVYQREVARQLGGLENTPNNFRLTGKTVKQIEDRARVVAMSETKDLLYDLAERGRFEEIVSNLMPFVGAWQEVVTRWSGIAVDNPLMIAQVVRNWRLLDAEDDEGTKLSIFRLPDILKYEWQYGANVKLFGKASILADTAVNLNVKSASMIGGLPGVGPLISYPVSEAVIANPELEDAVGWILPFGVYEGQRSLSRFISASTSPWQRAVAGSYTGGLGLDTPERAKTMLRITMDLAAEYEAGGDTIDNEYDWGVFEDEVARRTNQVLMIRAFGALNLPFSFRMQSPHWSIIEEYHEVLKENGVDAADTWLLHNHADLWVVTGRQTAAAGVATATLEGQRGYLRHKELSDAWPEIGGFIIGRVGAADVRFNFSKATQMKELEEGRRINLTPRDIYEGAQQTRGWKTWNEVTDHITDELNAKMRLGESGDIQAHPELLQFRRAAAVANGQENPAWYREYLAPNNPYTAARIMQGFREVISDPTFDYRPEWPFVQRFVDLHDSVASSMKARAEDSGNLEFLKLSYEGNVDLKRSWHEGVIELRLRPDFVDIYDRYFSKIESVVPTNFPWNFPMMNRNKELT
jgi:hypothetical protein